jgi:hypothetical protein
MHVPPQLLQVLATAVAQFHVLEVAPDALVRVQLRGVGGQPFTVQPPCGAGGEEGLDFLVVVDARPIPQHQQLARNAAQHLAQEGHHIHPAQRRRLLMHHQLPVWGDGADDGEVVARVRAAQHRRLAPGGIGPHHRRKQVEPRLVYGHERAAFRLGFASNADRRSWSQAALTASLRWLAGAPGVGGSGPGSAPGG